MSGWCLGNHVDLTARERLGCMVAAGLADLDGLSMLFGRDAYWEYHHKATHNLLFGFLVAAGLTAWSSRRVRVFLVYVALFHLHLVMDYFGSGPGWEIRYFWPFGDLRFEFAQAWEFYSWQNLSVGFAFVCWTLLIAMYKRRTPLEHIMPSLDAQLIAWLRNKRGRRE
jgi:inner membrane protein